MATISKDDLLWQNFKGGSANGSAETQNKGSHALGYEDSKYRIERCKFTVPTSMKAGATTVSFTASGFTHGGGATGFKVYGRVRSSASAHTANKSAADHGLTGGSYPSVTMKSGSTLTWTQSGLRLTPGSTYYLFLVPNNTSYGFYSFYQSMVSSFTLSGDIKYSVTYDANNGSGAPSNQSKTHGTNLTLRSGKPTRTGYTFTGWNTKADGSGTSYAVGATYKTNADVTLYAQWKKNKVEIAYYIGGAGASVNTSKYVIMYDSYIANKSNSLTYLDTVEYGSSIAPRTADYFGLTRTGHTFKNWIIFYMLEGGGGATDGNGAELTAGKSYSATTYTDAYKKHTASSGDVMCYLSAQWTANTYTVTFNANGGSVTPTSTSITYGSTYGNLPTPTKTGYVFTGWYTAQSGGDLVTSSTKVTTTGNRTLWARWTVDAQINSISHWTWGYKNQEGHNTGKNAFALETTTFSKSTDEIYIMDANYCVEIPKGFYAEQDFGTSSIDGVWGNYPFGTSIKQNNSSMYFEYDYWPIQYSITYANLGDATTNNPTSYNVLYGVNFSYPTKNRTGYLFSHWSDASTGNGILGINPGQNASFSSIADLRSKCNSRTIGDKTICANWTPKTIEVHYHYNRTDPITSFASQSFTYEAVADGTMRFGKDQYGNQIWDPEDLNAYSDYAATYGFGHWYWLGYKLVGWTDDKYNYINEEPDGSKNGFVSVWNDWINAEYNEHLNHVVDLYPILEPIGTVRIWDGSTWQYAFPYVYDDGQWKRTAGCVYKDGVWKVGV